MLDLNLQFVSIVLIVDITVISWENHTVTPCSILNTISAMITHDMSVMSRDLYKNKVKRLIKVRRVVKMMVAIMLA